MTGYARPDSLKIFESQFEESKDDETLIKKIIGKRYDAVIMTNSTAQTIIKKFDKKK